MGSCNSNGAELQGQNAGRGNRGRTGGDGKRQGGKASTSACAASGVKQPDRETHLYLPFNKLSGIPGIQYLEGVPGRHYIIADDKKPPPRGSSGRHSSPRKSGLKSGLGDGAIVWYLKGCGACSATIDLLRESRVFIQEQEISRASDWWPALVDSSYSGNPIGLPIVTRGGKAWWGLKPHEMLKELGKPLPRDDTVLVYGRGGGDGGSKEVAAALEDAGLKVSSKMVGQQRDEVSSPRSGRRKQKDESFLPALIASGFTGGVIQLPVVVKGNKAWWNFDRKNIARQVSKDYTPAREEVCVYGRKGCGRTTETCGILQKLGMSFGERDVDVDRSFIGVLSQNGYAPREGVDRPGVSLPVVVRHNDWCSGATAWWDFSEEPDDKDECPPREVTTGMMEHNWAWFRDLMKEVHGRMSGDIPEVETGAHSVFTIFSTPGCTGSALLYQEIIGLEPPLDEAVARVNIKDDHKAYKTMWDAIKAQDSGQGSGRFEGGPIRLPVVSYRGKMYWHGLSDPVATGDQAVPPQLRRHLPPR